MKLQDKVRFTEPQTGEKDLVFVVVNVNEVTGRALIECVNSGLSIHPTELVSVNDIELI